MANNQAQDRYNPPGTTGDDWEEHKFEALNNGELFWLDTKPQWSDEKMAYVNEAYRKAGDREAVNTTNQILLDVLSNITVYVKI